jgi:hypothetical protein
MLDLLQSLQVGRYLKTHHDGFLLIFRTIFSPQTEQSPWPLVRKGTIPTERPPLVDEI